jgi:hypothetical protein
VDSVRGPHQRSLAREHHASGDEPARSRAANAAAGIKVNTSPTDYYAVQQLQLMRFDGKRWVRFGDLVYDQ